MGGSIATPRTARGLSAEVPRYCVTRLTLASRGGRLAWWSTRVLRPVGVAKHAGAVGGWCGPEARAITRATSRGDRSLRSTGGHMDRMD